MKLTKKNKKFIDGLDYSELLSKWRFAPLGDPWFEGETGEYWEQRMGEKKKEVGHEKAVQASKDIGGER